MQLVTAQGQLCEAKEMLSLHLSTIQAHEQVVCNDPNLTVISLKPAVPSHRNMRVSCRAKKGPS